MTFLRAEIRTFILLNPQDMTQKLATELMFYKYMLLIITLSRKKTHQIIDIKHKN